MLGLYLHFPFCLSRCPYCDFASQVVESIPHARYADAILREADQRLAAGWPSGPARSLYVGGGTPSLWSPPQFSRVVEGLRTRLGFVPDAELTIEANPGASDLGDLRAFHQAGANRISFGTQSFHARGLVALGRWHSEAESFDAVAKARAAGFNNVSIDLIYGGPGQSLAEAEEDVARAVSTGPDHISAYALTLDAKVPMALQVERGELVLPDETLADTIESAVQQRLEEAGYRRYEISNYAKPGFEALHNNLYWQGADYLGLGTAAAGFRRFGPGRGGERSLNARTVERYLDQVDTQRLPQLETLGPKTLLKERLFLGLRLVDGLDLAELEAWSGLSVEAQEGAALRSLEARGLLAREGERLFATPLGLRFHNEIALAFV